MEFEANVTFVKRYSFKDDDGKNIMGTKIHYTTDEILDSDDKKGKEVIVLSADYDAFNQFTKVPGNYHFKCDMVPGPKNALKLKFNSATLIQK